jgi:hypothetical protein
MILFYASRLSNFRLKHHIRGIIVNKKTRPLDNKKVEALINKNGERRNHNGQLFTVKQAHSPQARMNKTGSAKKKRRLSSAGPGSVSDDTVLGQKKRQKTISGTDENELMNIELRLYKSNTSTNVQKLPILYLKADCTSDQCFTLVSDAIQADCNWLLFHLPEDMSAKGQIRVSRGTNDSEKHFSEVMDILSTAPTFYGTNETPRICEVEYGLDDFDF